MKPWIENLVQKGIRGVLTWASYSILFSKVRRTLVNMFGLAKEQADYVAGSLTPTLIERLCASSKSTPATGTEQTISIQQDLSKEETMAKTKKKWSFFKVILFLGALIALAIFILDRILPKPYEDEDIDDAWANDEDEGNREESEDETADAERPPTADIAYDVNEEDKEESDEGSSEEEPEDGKNKKDE